MPQRSWKFPTELPIQVVLPTAVLMLAASAYQDWVRVPEVPRGLLAIVPVVLTAWYIGRNTALVFSVLSVGLWLVVGGSNSIHTHGVSPSSLAVRLDNAAVRLVFNVVVAVLLPAAKSTSQRLERLVAERTTAIQRLAAQLSTAEHEERSRLAHDLHDALGQMLSLLKLNLQSAVAESPGDSHQHERLRESVTMVDQLIQQTRTLTFDMHPVMLDDLGLVPTLRWYSEELKRRANVEVTVSEEGKGPRLPASLASWLFRAIKEIYNNAIKHGQARQIITALHWTPAVLRVVIDDDGHGFDPAVLPNSPIPRRGLGLPGITDRLSALGGRIFVESESGQGARVILEIPLQE